MTKLILNRRHFIRAGAATLATPYFFTRASAQDRVLQVGVYNSAQGGLIKKKVLPAFEQEFGCKVLTTEGATLANLASLRATRDNPVYSVMSMDDAGVPQAKAEGLIEQLPMGEIPNLANVYPRYLFEDNYGVGFAVSIAGLFINPTTTQPIQSYEEIFDPKYARKILLNTPKNTQSVLMLIVAAALATGKPLAELVEERIARFPCSGEINFKVSDAKAAVARVMQHYADLSPQLDYTDGVSADFGDWRFNLRSSNTEPLLRLNVETRGDEALMQARTHEISDLINTSV
jgi:putative spermidine/putrescine transport system substrate-binding protein